MIFFWTGFTPSRISPCNEVLQERNFEGERSGDFRLPETRGRLSANLRFVALRTWQRLEL